MRPYTVIGYWDDSHQLFRHLTAGSSPQDAMIRAAVELRGGDDFWIAGAVEGDVEVHQASESGSLIRDKDMRELAEAS